MPLFKAGAVVSPQAGTYIFCPLTFSDSLRLPVLWPLVKSSSCLWKSITGLFCLFNCMLNDKMLKPSVLKAYISDIWETSVFTYVGFLKYNPLTKWSLVESSDSLFNWRWVVREGEIMPQSLQSHKSMDQRWGLNGFPWMSEWVCNLTLV